MEVSQANGGEEREIFLANGTGEEERDDVFTLS